MKIYYKKHNKSEKYCCSLSVVKEIFKNTNIKVNFGSFGRKYSPLPNEVGYDFYKKNIKGNVISKISIEYGNCNPMISFYIINNDEYSPILQEKFENEILDEMLNFYTNNILLTNKLSLLLVELIDGQLIIHKDIIK